MITKKKKPGPKKILVIEDHPIMRSGLAELIGRESDLMLCGEADDVDKALKAIEKLKPDIALVDITLKDSSGIDLIKDIKIRWPKLPVLVLSMHEEFVYAERVLRAGARGYVTKTGAATTVIAAVRQVLSGGVYLSENIISKVLHRMVGAGNNLDTFPIDRLSDREFEVFDLIGQGLEMRQIAQKLHLSVKTIDTHREHMKRKLNLGSATELLKYAVQWIQSERGV